MNQLEFEQTQQIELLKLDCSKSLEGYKHDLELHRINARGVLDFALAAVRLLIIVNGAAAAGILTFIGNKTATLDQAA